MARQATITVLRTTRANLDSQASAGNLVTGEPYLITDENRLAIATSLTTYTASAIQGEGGASSAASWGSVTGTLSNQTDLNNALGAKANLASPALTGTPTTPTATSGTNTTQIASTAFVSTAGSTKANIASPTFTGTPAAPTATAGTSTTQIATTAFVATAVATKAGKYSVSIGDTSALTYLVTHNLGTTDVVVYVKDNNNVNVWADVTTNSTTQVSIAVKAAPGTNGLRVTVIG